MTVAVLFARSDSVYKFIPGCDVFDIDRDARTFTGCSPVIAHPPCRSWGRLRHFAKPRPDEKELAFFAVDSVRSCGGVLEHPSGSSLWGAACLPAPGKRDSYGGFTLGINQHWFGHRAEKSTLLYIVGVSPGNVPIVPFSLDYPSHVVQSKTNSKHITRAEREQTPLAFALWLVDLANRCGGAL